jgi:hypothetical protein
MSLTISAFLTLLLVGSLPLFFLGQIYVTEQSLSFRFSLLACPDLTRKTSEQDLFFAQPLIFLKITVRFLMYFCPLTPRGHFNLDRFYIHGIYTWKSRSHLLHPVIRDPRFQVLFVFARMRLTLMIPILNESSILVAIFRQSNIL